MENIENQYVDFSTYRQTEKISKTSVKSYCYEKLWICPIGIWFSKSFDNLFILYVILYGELANVG